VNKHTNSSLNPKEDIVSLLSQKQGYYVQDRIASPKNTLPTQIDLDFKQFTDTIHKKDKDSITQQVHEEKDPSLATSHDIDIDHISNYIVDQSVTDCTSVLPPRFKKNNTKSESISIDDGEIKQEDTNKRWKREDDKRLFQLIREFEDDGVFTFKELINMNLSDAIHNEGIVELARQFEWKGLNKALVTRIKSLSKKDFSARELKQLKSMLRKVYHYKDFDYNEILYEFPGKHINRLREVCGLILIGRESKSL
jgi:hypothetical protein